MVVDGILGPYSRALFLNLGDDDGVFGVQGDGEAAADRRNPATSGEITDAPQHGSASFLGASARYIADRDYAGPATLRLAEIIREHVSGQCRKLATQ